MKILFLIIVNIQQQRTGAKPLLLSMACGTGIEPPVQVRAAVE